MSLIKPKTIVMEATLTFQCMLMSEVAYNKYLPSILYPKNVSEKNAITTAEVMSLIKPKTIVKEAMQRKFQYL